MLTTRALLLFLIAAPLVALSAYAPALLTVAAGYVLLVVVMIVTDMRISPQPDDFEAVRQHDTRLSLGAWNLVQLAIRNNSQQRVALAARDEPPAVFGVDALLVSGQVFPRDQVTLAYRVRPPRRGDYVFGNINLRWPGALGLVVRQATYPARGSVKVYPNLLEIRKYDLLVRRGHIQELGLRLSRRFGEGTEFERLRDYLPDDDYRRIDWKATARRRRPITREFQTERSQNIVAAIDLGRMMRSPVGELSKLDHVINAVLLLAYVATRKGDRVGLLTFADAVGVFLPPRQGTGQFYRMLEVLYGAQSQPVEPDYAEALAYLGVKNKKRSLVVLFTDLSGGPSVQALVANLGALYPRHLPVCVTISDPAILAAAAAHPRDSANTYERMVAEHMLDERRVLLESLHRRGVLTLDVPADKLTIAVINKYLELKGRGRI